MQFLIKISLSWIICAIFAYIVFTLVKLFKKDEIIDEWIPFLRCLKYGWFAALAAFILLFVMLFVNDVEDDAVENIDITEEEK
jgi:hypothetical protein